MAQVSNLAIKVQSGTTNTAYATWDFKSTVTTTNPSIRLGSWVRIKSGARWYNGVGIDKWVFGHEWKVIQLNGSRAVLNENRSGSNHIMSPIHINNLTSTEGGTTTVTEDTVDHYTVKWAYDSGDNVWFDGGSSDVKVKTATYSIQAVPLPSQKIPSITIRSNGHTTQATTFGLTVDRPTLRSRPPRTVYPPTR